MIKEIKLKNVIIPNNLILAPLAGYTDAAMRRLCREAGAGLTVSEMVSVKGLLYKNKNTADLLCLAKNEKPAAVQLFGSDADSFFEVIKNDELLFPFDIIDINMGCPVKKIVSSGDGSALLDNPKKAAKIVEAATKASEKPITVKIRIPKDYYHNDKTSVISLGSRFQKATGFTSYADVPDVCFHENKTADTTRSSLPSDDTKNTVLRVSKNNHTVLDETIKLLAGSGASMITIHGRTAKMMYGGKADWDAIDLAAQKSSLPIIGNGDILTHHDILARLDSAVSGVMIGRGAIGNPDIFSIEMAACGNHKSPKSFALATSSKQISPAPAPNPLAVGQRAMLHIKYMTEYFGEKYTVINMRKHLAYYVKGLSNMREFKSQINYADSVDALTSLIKQHLN